MKSLWGHRWGWVVLGLMLALGAALYPSPALAWDPFGLGEAAGKIADATWKVVAIHAIESARFVILTGLVVWGMTVCVERVGGLAEHITQDNRITRGEGVLMAAVLALITPLALFLVVLGAALIKQLAH